MQQQETLELQFILIPIQVEKTKSVGAGKGFQEQDTFRGGTRCPWWGLRFVALGSQHVGYSKDPTGTVGWNLPLGSVTTPQQPWDLLVHFPDPQTRFSSIWANDTMCH